MKIALKLAAAILGIALIMAMAVTAPVLLWVWMPTNAGLVGLCCLGSVLVLAALAVVIVASRRVRRAARQFRPGYALQAVEPPRQTYRRMVGRRAVEYDALTHQPVRTPHAFIHPPLH